MSFRRSIRLRDKDVHRLQPPDLGAFPLESVSKYGSQFLKKMADKGGVFFPMYQREAMRIKFESKKRYHMKIHLSEKNVISGEPAVETPATIERRRQKLKDSRSRAQLSQQQLQDYIIVPRQESLYNHMTIAGTARQFAEPHPRDHYMEAQTFERQHLGEL
jgi:hypothetical protein